MQKVSYSKRLIVVNIAKIVVVFLVLVVLLYWTLRSSFSEFVEHKRWLDPTFMTAGISLIIGVLTGMAEMRLIQRGEAWLDKTLLLIKKARKGNWGERKTFERLHHMLGNRYRIYRNFRIPGQKFDFDALVVGPKGILTFEVKNIGERDDRFRFEGTDVYKITRHRNGSECTCKLGDHGNANPVKQAVRNNQILEEWLMKNGHERIRVKGAVLMTSDAKIEEVKDPAVHIIKGLGGIKHFVEGVFEDQKFTEDYCSKLNLLFSLK